MAGLVRKLSVPSLQGTKIISTLCSNGVLLKCWSTARAPLILKCGATDHNRDRQANRRPQTVATATVPKTKGAFG